MSNDKYTFSESLKGELTLAILMFIPLLFTITGIVQIIQFNLITDWILIKIKNKLFNRNKEDLLLEYL